MGKNKKLKQNITRENYWEDWTFINLKTDEVFFRIPYSNEDELNLEILNRLEEYAEFRNFHLIPDILRLEPKLVFTFKTEIALIMQEACNNEDIRNLFNEIAKAVIHEQRGRRLTENLKNIIEFEIIDFKEMVFKRLKGETVIEITEDYEPSLNTIWKNYIKISRMIIQELKLDEKDPEDWEFIIDIFNSINEYHDSTEEKIFLEHKDLILGLIKGYNTNWDLWDTQDIEKTIFEYSEKLK